MRMLHKRLLLGACGANAHHIVLCGGCDGAWEFARDSSRLAERSKLGWVFGVYLKDGGGIVAGVHSEYGLGLC